MASIYIYTYVHEYVYIYIYTKYNIYIYIAYIHIINAVYIYIAVVFRPKSSFRPTSLLRFHDFRVYELGLRVSMF